MMKRVFTIFAFAALGCVIFASDENLKRGIPGIYSRVFGMESTDIDLRRDGIYVITSQGCLPPGREEGRGRWTIRDGVLLLDRSGDSKEKRGKLSRFDIEVLDGEIALRALDDVYSSANPEDESLLFRYQKKAANVPEPAPGAAH